MWKYNVKKVTIQDCVEICGTDDLTFLKAVTIFWVQQLQETFYILETILFSSAQLRILVLHTVSF